MNKKYPECWDEEEGDYTFSTTTINEEKSLEEE